MTMAQNLGAYADCEAYWDKALAASRGIAITMDSAGQAKRLIQRLNAYRVLLRKRNQEIYPAGDPRWGVSIYDGHRASLDPDNPARVLIRPSTPATVEEL